ncbi:MAG: hypothetical protein ACI30J_03795 [Paludibacteraceae bacterium]
MPIDFNHLTQEELRDFEFLRERKLSQLAALLIQERGLSFDNAFRELYNSEVYEKLSDPRTGLYIQSARYIYSYLENELNTGKISN